MAAAARLDESEHEHLQITVKAWLLESPCDTLDQLSVMLCKARLGRHEYAQVFDRRMCALLVYSSNQLERTLHESIKMDEVFHIVDAVAASSKASTLPSTPTSIWAVDGNPAAREQIVQHVRATRYLFDRITEPLSVDIVMKTHAILMADAVNEDGTRVNAGKLRDHAAHASTHAYPEGVPDQLYASLTRIVERFNGQCEHPDRTAFVTASVRLFYDVITLHPFEDGNGRLCRLLFAYAVRRFGIPFAVPLTTGHSKARGHYMRAILRARRGSIAELHMMGLMSIDGVLCNFMENLRLLPT